MKNKNICVLCICLSLFVTKSSASDGYQPLLGQDSGRVSAKSECCWIGMKDSKTHEKKCRYLVGLSSLGAFQTAALSFGAAYSSSKIVCIGLSSVSGCTGCISCAAVALAARECTLAQVAYKQERLQEQGQDPLPVAPFQHVMPSFPSK